MGNLEFPYREAQTSPIISQGRRLELLREVTFDSEAPAADRLACMLLLLYGQPLTAVTRLKLEHVRMTDSELEVDLSGNQEPFADPGVMVPPPFDSVVLAHLRSLPNMNTAAHASNTWLFPGMTPGQPIHPNSLMMRLREYGIDIRGSKNASLRALVLELPAAFVAESFGYSYGAAERHRAASGAAHIGYVARRSETT